MKIDQKLKVAHTNATSFERYCCFDKLYKESIHDEVYGYFDRVYNATKLCFWDLNLTKDEQIELGQDFDDLPYNVNDCYLQIGPCSVPTTPSHIAYMCLWVLLLIVTISSNLTVIMAVQKVSYLRDNTGNFLISSLAASDFLVGLFLIPIKMKFAYHNLNFCSVQLCRFYVTADNAFFSTSITNLFVISIDRYMALHFPFKHRTWLTLLRCKLLIAGIWTYGMTWGILSNFNWRHPSEPSVHIRMNQCLLNNNYYVATINIMVFYIPAAAIAIVYFRVLKIARYHARAISDSVIFRNNRTVQKEDSVATIHSNCVSTVKSAGENTPPVSEDRESISVHAEEKDANMNDVNKRSSRAIQTLKYRKMSWKASKTVATVYFTFFFCWFPVSALSLALAFCRECFDEYQLKWFYLIFVEVIPIFHSMINPFIYGFMNKQYRRAYKDVFSQLKAFAKTYLCIKTQIAK